MGGVVQVVDLEDDGKLVQAHVPPTPRKGNTRKRAISVEHYNPIQETIIDDNDKVQEIKKLPRSVSPNTVEVKTGVWSEDLSDHPRASIYHNFLNKEDCQHLINLAKPHLTRSMVGSSTASGSEISSNRTSFGAWINIGADEIVRSIEKRIMEITSIPIENGEQFNILRYEVGQKFTPHFDYREPCNYIGGPRQATFLIYLSDVEKGGETAFPNGIPKDNSGVQRRKGITVKPKMGDALLFWSMKPDGTLDPASLHSGCPVLKGTKWLCTKWLHVSKSY